MRELLLLPSFVVVASYRIGDLRASRVRTGSCAAALTALRACAMQDSPASDLDPNNPEETILYQCDFCSFVSESEAVVVAHAKSCAAAADVAASIAAAAPLTGVAPSSVPATNSSTSHRAGFVSILGVPNVGKSTLLNALVGERLSIATSKPQTTRHRIMGILNGDDYQIVYSDTPGVLLPQYKLQEGMMAFVRSSINDADVLILVVDIFQDSFPDEQVLRQLCSSPAALLVLLNKVDLLAEDAPNSERRRAELGTVEQLQQRWATEFPDATVLPIAARDSHGVDEVLRYVLALMPEHPPYFPKDELSDKPERFFAAEFLREAIFEQYREEVPYSCEVVVESFKETDQIIRMRANIYVSHDSQKGIVIGHRGAALKKVGTASRRRLEDFFQKQVFLETRVKVKKNWREDEGALAGFGYL